MSDNPTFRYALAASLALHALVLSAFPGIVDTARRAASGPPQIMARLMEPEPAPAKPVPERRLAAAAQKSAAQTQTPEAPLPVAPSLPLAAVEPRPASSAPAAETPDALSRDRYRVQLIDEARRHKRYPPLARENNWQGDVRVAVVIAMNGWPSVTLRASSGYEVLDRQAVEMFTLAARAVPVPPALRGKEFALDVRAVYDLED